MTAPASRNVSEGIRLRWSPQAANAAMKTLPRLGQDDAFSFWERLVNWRVIPASRKARAVTACGRPGGVA